MDDARKAYDPVKGIVAGLVWWCDVGWCVV